MWIPMRRLRLDMRTRSAGPRRLSRSLLAGGLIALAASGAGAAQRLQVGLGDRYDQMVNGKRVVVYQTAAKDGLRFKYVALWLTPGWPEWVRKPLLERIIRDGGVSTKIGAVGHGAQIRSQGSIEFVMIASVVFLFLAGMFMVSPV